MLIQKKSKYLSYTAAHLILLILYYHPGPDKYFVHL